MMREMCANCAPLTKPFTRNANGQHSQVPAAEEFEMSRDDRI